MIKDQTPSRWHQFVDNITEAANNDNIGLLLALAILFLAGIALALMVTIASVRLFGIFPTIGACIIVAAAKVVYTGLLTK